MNTVTFVDTSVLCELLQVPGKSDPDRSQQLLVEMDRRHDAGERFVIPITTIIETGNHIAQSNGDRHQLARRLVGLLRLAASGDSPWLVLQTQLGPEFLDALCGGDSTGETFEDLSARKVGAGDIALLVERDQFRTGTAVSRTQVWTLDSGLAEAAGRVPS